MENKRKNRTKRHYAKLSDKKLTDQSYKKMCDINEIIAQYRRTGMLPHMKQKQPMYVDTTELPNFLEAFSIVQEAKDLFYELPSDVRKLMNHDPSQLESFIKDEENKDICIKHNLFTKKIVSDATAPEQSDIKDSSKEEVKED